MQNLAPVLHPELETVLNFLRVHAACRPDAFAHAAGLTESPGFFSVSKLQALLNNPLLNPDWIDLRLGGAPVSLKDSVGSKTVQRKSLMFMDKSKINDCLRRGGAVVLEGIDILDAQINDFIGRVDDAFPCALANCVAFFSQQQNEAYGGHRDSDDVLVVQISGQKNWRLFEPQQRRYLNNSPLSPEEMGREIARLTLKAGDAMYIRAGVPHICQTSADHSLHLSFDLCDRSPAVEQITGEANLRYNHASEDPHVPARRVVDSYVSLIKSDAFLRDLENATHSIREEARAFRRRIGCAGNVDALSRYIR